MDIYPNSTTLQREFLDIGNVQKPQRDQAFKMVEMYPTNRMGKPTGNKPMEIKCKLETGASICGMSLRTH